MISICVMGEIIRETQEYYEYPGKAFYEKNKRKCWWNIELMGSLFKETLLMYNVECCMACNMAFYLVPELLDRCILFVKLFLEYTYEDDGHKQ